VWFCFCTVFLNDVKARREFHRHLWWTESSSARTFELVYCNDSILIFEIFAQWCGNRGRRTKPLPTEIFTCLDKTELKKKSISTLRCLKDWRRNTNGEERFNGSALLNIRREIDITAEEIINKFTEYYIFPIYHVDKRKKIITIFIIIFFISSYLKLI